MDLARLSQKGNSNGSDNCEKLRRVFEGIMIGALEDYGDGEGLEDCGLFRDYYNASVGPGNQDNSG